MCYAVNDSSFPLLISIIAQHERGAVIPRNLFPLIILTIRDNSSTFLTQNTPGGRAAQGDSALAVFRLRLPGGAEPAFAVLPAVRPGKHSRCLSPCFAGAALKIAVSFSLYRKRKAKVLIVIRQYFNHNAICIFFQWFNPGAWLLKQELQNIHEYEADETVINEGVNAKEYQLLLIKKAVGTRLYSMANSFNHSKLKKRITMMLKEKSNPWARLKYLYVLPLAAIAVTAFARPEISEKMEEISVAKVNDLAAIVEKKSEENVVKEPADTAKNRVIVVGYRAEKKDSVLTSGEKKVALSVRGVSGEEKPLVIINGKESDYEVVNALNPERIESISVIGAEKAIKIYGEKAKDGLMDIKLYSEKKFKPKKIEIGSLNKTRLDALNSGAKNWGVTFHSATGGKPLIIIDGKEASGDDPLANISPDRIRSISVLKDKNALAAYGDKGKNGVIEVNLLVKEEYQVRQIPIRTVNDTVTSTIKITASEE